MKLTNYIPWLIILIIIPFIITFTEIGETDEILVNNILNIAYICVIFIILMLARVITGAQLKNKLITEDIYKAIHQLNKNMIKLNADVNKMSDQQEISNYKKTKSNQNEPNISQYDLNMLRNLNNIINKK